MEIKTLEEIVRDRTEHKDDFIGWLHDSVNLIDKYMGYAIEDYKVRAIYQEALLLIMTHLGVDEITVSDESVSKTKNRFVGKIVNIKNTLNDDGSRTIGISIQKSEEE